MMWFGCSTVGLSNLDEGECVPVSVAPLSVRSLPDYRGPGRVDGCVGVAASAVLDTLIGNAYGRRCCRFGVRLGMNAQVRPMNFDWWSVARSENLAPHDDVAEFLSSAEEFADWRDRS